MKLKICGRLSLAVLVFVAVECTNANAMTFFRQTGSDQEQAARAAVVTVEQLKAKLAHQEPITIIDVRGADEYNGSESKIKGAIRVQVRKLRYRLGFSPLKDVPRDQEVVAYCACPNDEASVFAAQILSRANFKRVLVLKGGWQAWLKAKGPVEAKAKGL